jgi:CBS domain-containing protein
MHYESSQVSPDTALLETLLILYKTRASLPVVDPETGKLLGVISYFDVGEKILSAGA